MITQNLKISACFAALLSTSSLFTTSTAQAELDSSTHFETLEISATGFRFTTAPNRGVDLNVYGLDFNFAYSPRLSIVGGVASDPDELYRYLHGDMHWFVFPDQYIKPFVTAGLGALGGSEIDNASFASAGAGLRIPLTDRLFIEPLVRWHWELGSGDTDAAAGVRLTAQLSHRRPIKSAYDSDNDGIADDKDSCFNCDQLTEVEPVQEPEPEPILLPPEEVEKRLETLALEDRIHFEFDKSDITANAKALIDDYLDRVVGEPVEVLIEGHCDSSGSVDYNQKLSEQRARSVQELLEPHGVRSEIIVTIGYGETRPKFSNESRADRRRNRRVELNLKQLTEVIEGFRLPSYADPKHFKKIYFPYAESFLMPNAERMLNKLAAYLLENQMVFAYISGQQTISTKNASIRNTTLATERAASVRQYLIQIGVPAGRLRITDPTEGASEGLETARRVNITLNGDTGPLPITQAIRDGKISSNEPVDAKQNTLPPTPSDETTTPEIVDKILQEQLDYEEVLLRYGRPSPRQRWLSQLRVRKAKTAALERALARLEKNQTEQEKRLKQQRNIQQQ